MAHEDSPRRIVGETSHTSSGLANIHTADFHEEWVGIDMGNFTGTLSILASPANAGDTSVTVTSDAAFTVGDRISITEGVKQETLFPEVTAKPGGNVLTLDRPLDSDFTAIASVEIVDVDLANAVGTLASPITYKVRPPGDAIWHIKRLTISMRHASSGSDDLFGSIAPLANGVIFRENKATIRSIANWKINSDARLSAGVDVFYIDKFAASDFGTSIRWSHWKIDSIIHLNGFQSESLDVLAQDDLTGLTSFRVQAQLHVEEA